eukprot:gnl/TRDRNA2_/TRDRNA2_81299_c0_seq1.p2 gnl/TRDRNA2_/TRDRNA2_81299_c0~~gnl/TRDRNA2_/TRDRNA2_81299_c0_seq1.p2  ORF type:complete len:140 (+),score=51.96 gnl/TRDRNA2_/TRDRNA2_81299_c0_seq1:161-580(+)
MAGKRKRHKKKPDLKNVKVKIEKKRGRTVVSAEAELKRTTKELNDEIRQLKEAKGEMRQAKDRNRRQPAPIAERRALDFKPVKAGQRMDRRTRMLNREAIKAEKEAKRERRAVKKAKKEQAGKQEVDMQNELGADFFGK